MQLNFTDSRENSERHAENPVVLRCKSEKGQCIIELTSASTLSDLVAKVAASTGISQKSLVLRSGYPPKPIILNSENAKLTLHEVSLAYKPWYFFIMLSVLKVLDFTFCLIINKLFHLIHC